MASRNLLAIHKLDAFRAWLDEHGIEHRPTNANYQVLQVRIADDPRWHAIYQKIAAEVHLSVPGPLVPLVRQFVSEKKPPAAKHTTRHMEPLPAAQDLLPWE